jgi:serine/threonine protein kinase/beta-lactam-binding protein with PASTA domain
MRTVLNSSVDPLLGRLLDGRYEISGRLAQGGMAVVYSAFDTRLDRAVAVKVMHPALAADEDFVGRFRREAKAAARLSNPHVVTVTDQGRDGDVIFLVMELIEGRTLREVLREEGRLSAPDALEIMIPVLDALAAAHRAGLVHRDVKPENVLVADDGTVKVGDFGLARAVDASPLTATAGLLMGTVAYLAPEQVARGVADARADVYACGVMLFELLTGRPPYEGTSALQVAYQHLNEDVPAPSSLVADIPAAVDRLVAAATARNPADRPHDATAMLYRTRAVLERLDPAARNGPAQVRGRHDTAPLGIEFAEAAALAQAETPPEPSSIDAIVETLDDSYADISLNKPAVEGRANGEVNGRVRSAPSRVMPPASPNGQHDTLDNPAPPVEVPRKQKSGSTGPRRRWFLRRSRIVALVVVLAALAAGLVGWQLATRTVPVPNVLGKSPAAAQSELQSAHLTPHLVAVQVYSETAKKGTVAAVDPAPGKRINRGADVAVSVSLGPERYTVPTVTELKLADAVSALRVAHLHAETPTTIYHDTVPKGSVVSIDPTPGKLVKPDTAIAIVVSDGPAPVTAPKVAGLQAQAALDKLVKLGLKVTTTYDFSETVDSGQVIGIIPATGLHRMQSVKLSVSKGPQLVVVPYDIEDVPASIAKAELRALGLKVSTLSAPGFGSSVAKSLPGPGTSVRIGSEVTLVLY